MTADGDSSGALRVGDGFRFGFGFAFGSLLATIAVAVVILYLIFVVGCAHGDLWVFNKIGL